KLANAAQYAEMLNDLSVYELPVSEWQAANDAYRSTGVYTRPNGQERVAPYSPEDIEKYRAGNDPWNYPNTDWYKETLKTWSPQSRHNLQLTGGGKTCSTWPPLATKTRMPTIKTRLLGSSNMT